MTTDEFSKVATDWIATARHPITGRRFTETVSQPMLELLAYLRAKGFKTFIHTDGEREWACDRRSHVGTLDKALDEAAANGWTVVDMAKKWKTINSPSASVR